MTKTMVIPIAKIIEGLLEIRADIESNGPIFLNVETMDQVIEQYREISKKVMGE